MNVVAVRGNPAERAKNGNGEGAHYPAVAMSQSPVSPPRVPAPSLAGPSGL